MDAVVTPAGNVINDEKLATTVKFLWEVWDKGFQNKATLETYLMSKRGLSRLEVDEAFRIHRARMEKITQKEQSGDRPEQRRTYNDADRPEKFTECHYSKDVNFMSFLVEERKSEGEKLFKEFMQHEIRYYKILECLCTEYYSPLIIMSKEGKFEMTHEELKTIFERVPGLLTFHRDIFWNQLSHGADIPKTFLRFFKTFGGYVDYMKGCMSTVKMMQKYTGDEKLHGCLEQIKKKSQRPHDKMIDLLLVPLDRMSDYKEFLELLSGWADRTQTASWETISKANRRFGRLSNYIEKYKLGIFNLSEMNKVQHFLGNQCNIFIPDRRIVRRGVMMRRTTGWTKRNKQYIFFLFNDALLWTSKKGELQNVVMLRECEVMETESKHHRSRKLKLVSMGAKNKVLHLECGSQHQRDEWYYALESTISRQKEASSDQGVNREDFGTSIEMLTPEPNKKGKGEETFESESKENVGIRLGDYESTSPGTPVSEIDNGYEYSLNFPNEELFKDFEPMDDMSVSEQSAYDEGKMESANNLFSPFPKYVTSSDSTKIRKEFKINRLKRGEENVTLSEVGTITITEGENDRDAYKDNTPDRCTYPVNKSEINVPLQNQLKSNIIRHTRPLDKDSQKKPLVATKLENIPNITIRLNEFDFT